MGREIGVHVTSLKNKVMLSVDKTVLTDIAKDIYNAVTIEKRRQAFWRAMEHFSYVGEGVGRVAFRDGDVVIKFAKSPEMYKFEKRRENRKGTPLKSNCDGKNQMRKEINLFNKTSSENLLPVLDYHEDYLWGVYPYIDNMEIPYGGVGEFREQLNIRINDVKSSNMGWYNGRIVLIDYGLGYKGSLDQDTLANFV